MAQDDLAKNEQVSAILRGIKDGIRDEVITWDQVSACFDGKTLDALAVLVETANKKRRKLPKDKRRPWRTATPDDILAAQQIARDATNAQSKRKLRTFAAEVSHGDG